MTFYFICFILAKNFSHIVIKVLVIIFSDSYYRKRRGGGGAAMGKLALWWTLFLRYYFVETIVWDFETHLPART